MFFSNARRIVGPLPASNLRLGFVVRQIGARRSVSWATRPDSARGHGFCIPASSGPISIPKPGEGGSSSMPSAIR